jgi:hypothetical protein
VVEAIVSSDCCRRFIAATPIADRGLLNHAFTGHGSGVAAFLWDR